MSTTTSGNSARANGLGWAAQTSSVNWEYMEPWEQLPLPTYQAPDALPLVGPTRRAIFGSSAAQAALRQLATNSTIYGNTAPANGLGLAVPIRLTSREFTEP